MRTPHSWGSHSTGQACCGALQTAAAESGVSFIDATSWIHGTGRVGDPRGDGDADTLTSPDGVHPTPAGHAYLAQKTANALRPLLNGTGN